MAGKREKKEENKKASGEVVIIHGEDDLVGVYIDGELHYEGHGIRPKQLVELLGIKCRDVECDIDWYRRLGKLPKNLKDIKNG